MDFQHIYSEWKNIQHQQPNADIATYEGRNQLYRSYRAALHEGQQEAFNQAALRLTPAAATYFDRQADEFQRLRDMIETAYFHENRHLSLMARAKKIMAEKKHEEVQSALNSLMQESQYQRWLQIRYQCHLEQAMKKAMEDCMAMYQKDYADKQPSPQNSLFPRFDQVIQNSLHESRSYAQGWLGYSAAALFISVGCGLGAMLKYSRAHALKQREALDVIDDIKNFNLEQEQDALSYVLLCLKRDYSNLMSEQEKKIINDMIEIRQQRYPVVNLPAGLIHHQDLDAYEAAHPEYTNGLKQHLKDMNLVAQENAFETALNFYQDLFYTKQYSLCAQQLLKNQEIDLIAFQRVHFFLNGENQDPALSTHELFLSQTLDRFEHFIQHTDQRELLDESQQARHTQAGQRQFTTFKNLEKQHNLLTQGLQDANESIPQALLSGFKSTFMTFGQEAIQEFGQLQYKYLAGDSQHQQQSSDGMPDVLKSRLATARQRP